MSSWRAPVLGLCALAWASPLLAADSGSLTIANRSRTEIAGSFRHGETTVVFSSRMEAPGRASVRVETESLRLEAWADFEAQVARTEGHGSVMTLKDRRALEALYASLRPHVSAADAVLVSHEALLYRRLAFWSEAPVGITFGTRQIGPPEHGVSPLPRSGSGDPMGPSSCQRSDEDGIRYFSCSVSSQVECHDAANHCWTCASRSAGRNSHDCAGECGPGCNGINAYTWDCLDHDYCGRIHGGSLNPWDSECGDEYWEADDDFFWAWPNC